MEVLIQHEGQDYAPFQPGAKWGAAWDRLSPEEAEKRRRIINDGMLMAPDEGGDYEPMDESTAKRVKARLLGTYAQMPPAGYAPQATERQLIPGLWTWGHKPMLSGQPRAGKSTFVAELLAALLNPGEQFIGHYAPADLTDEERARGVWLINAENPVPEQHAQLEHVGLESQFYDDPAPRYYSEDPDAEGWLIVEHLEHLPVGASFFDLRNPVNYDLWANRFMDESCQACDGTDDLAPLVVIVDGLTAILGSDTKAYGEWYAKFRQLMQELGVPNALVVVHSPMNGGEAMNGVESIAQADGTWKYTMGNVHNNDSPRYFSGSRRLTTGGIRGGRVVLDDDGRLRLSAEGKPTRATATGEPVQEPVVDSWEAQILERLGEAGAEGVRKTDLTGSGSHGASRRAAVHRLSDRGEIVSREEPAKGRGRVSTRWYLLKHAPPA